MTHYEVLGVSKDASPREIKHAYKKLAHKYHPDRPEGDTARFQSIQRAYDVLGDPEKRANYDKYGEDSEGDQTDYEGSARMTLRNLFSMAIGASQPGRIKDYCESNLVGSLNQLKAHIRNNEHSLLNMKKLRGAMRVKEGANNDFDAVVSEKIAQVEVDLRGMKAGLRITEMALEMLQDYENVWANPYQTTDSTFQLTRQW